MYIAWYKLDNGIDEYYDSVERVRCEYKKAETAKEERAAITANLTDFMVGLTLKN